MSKFRMVRTEFWEDPKVVEELTPEDKYFFLYLLTNSKTTQIGIYQITKKQMAFDTGYSIESINALLDRFINHHKLVVYNDKTREIAIKNWGKYNFNRGGKPIIDCVNSELQQVKDKKLILFVGRKVEKKEIRKIYEWYGDTSDDTGNDTGNDTSNKKWKSSKVSNDKGSYDTYNDTPTTGGQEQQQEKEKEEEKEEEKQQEKQQEVNALTIFWDKNGFGEDNHFAKKSLLSFENEFDFDDFDSLAFKAMNIACEANKRNISYVKGILNNWNKQGIKNLQQLEEQSNKQSYKQQDKKPHDPSMDQYTKLLG